jgi:hypothetical protein
MYVLFHLTRRAVHGVRPLANEKEKEKIFWMHPAHAHACMHVLIDR